MGKDYYKILNVPRDADDRTIKKAYRKLAMRWHPDKNPDNREAADVQFKEINEAYQVLSDKEKRAIFDRHGEEGLTKGVPDGSGGFSGGGFSFDPRQANSVFSQFFGSDNFADAFVDGGGFGGTGLSGMFGAFGGDAFTRAGGRAKRQPPQVMHLYCSLEELFRGCTKRMKVTRQRLNPDGVNTHPEEKILSIEVKPGYRAGTKITFEREGDEGNNIIASDMVFLLQEKPHPRFDRSGHDLVAKVNVTLAQALTGVVVPIQTLDGRYLQIPINEIICPGYEKIIPSEGMPRSKTPQTRGNLIIRFNVQYPTHLSETQKKQLKAILV